MEKSQINTVVQESNQITYFLETEREWLDQHCEISETDKITYILEKEQEWLDQHCKFTETDNLITYKLEK